MKDCPLPLNEVRPTSTELYSLKLTSTELDSSANPSHGWPSRTTRWCCWPRNLDLEKSTWIVLLGLVESDLGLCRGLRACLFWFWASFGLWTFLFFVPFFLFLFSYYLNWGGWTSRLALLLLLRATFYTPRLSVPVVPLPQLAASDSPGSRATRKRWFWAAELYFTWTKSKIGLMLNPWILALDMRVVIVYTYLQIRIWSIFTYVNIYIYLHIYIVFQLYKKKYLYIYMYIKSIFYEKT